MKKNWMTKGFTLFETLIVIAIALPVLTILMGMFNTISKTQAHTSELEQVQDAMLTLIHDLSQEIHAADTAEITLGGRFNQLDLHSFQIDDPATTYLVTQGRLTKNSVYLTPKDVTIEIFQVENLASQNTVGLLDFTIVIASKREPQIQLTQHISISLRDSHKETEQKKLIDKISF